MELLFQAEVDIFKCLVLSHKQSKTRKGSVEGNQCSDFRAAAATFFPSTHFAMQINESFQLQMKGSKQELIGF